MPRVLERGPMAGLAGPVCCVCVAVQMRELTLQRHLFPAFLALSAHLEISRQASLHMSPQHADLPATQKDGFGGKLKLF